jgi:hypothetical protein
MLSVIGKNWYLPPDREKKTKIKEKGGSQWWGTYLLRGKGGGVEPIPTTSKQMWSS